MDPRILLLAIDLLTAARNTPAQAGPLAMPAPRMEVVFEAAPAPIALEAGANRRQAAQRTAKATRTPQPKHQKAGRTHQPASGKNRRRGN